MSWTEKTVSGMLVSTNTVTLSTTGTQYTDAFSVNLGGLTNKYLGLVCVASHVSGTNLDVSLYGSADGTTYVQLLDAPGSIGDITGAAETKSATFDIKPYPMPYYKYGFLVDADETGNTVAVTMVDGDPQ